MTIDPGDGFSYFGWKDTLFRAQLETSPGIKAATVKSVALAAATYGNTDDGEEVRPGVARLAVELGLSGRTIERAFNELRRAAILVRVRRGPRKSGGTDVYRLNMRPRCRILTKEEHAQAVQAAKARRASRRDTGSGTSVPPAETGVSAGRTDVPLTGRRDTGSGTSVPPAETGVSAGRTDVRDEVPLADFVVELVHELTGEKITPEDAGHGIRIKISRGEFDPRGGAPRHYLEKLIREAPGFWLPGR